MDGSESSKRSIQASNKQYPDETLEERELRLKNKDVKILECKKESMELRQGKM